MSSTSFRNIIHSVVTVVSLILIFIMVLFSNRTGQISLKKGDVSPEDVYAPRAIIDQTTTDASREAARANVENVYVPNDNKRISAVENITGLFAQATAMRSESDMASFSDAARLQAEVKLDISARTANILMTASESDFSKLREVISIVDSAMAAGISDLSAAKAQCSAKVDKLNISGNHKEAANEIIALVLTTNLELDEEETERRRQAAEDSVPSIEYKKNQIIVRKGEIVSQPQIDMLATLGLLEGSSPLSLTYSLGVSLLILICYIVLILYFWNLRKKASVSLPITAVASLLIVIISFYSGKYVPESMITILPLGILPGIVAMFSGPRTATVTNMVMAVFCGISFDASWSYTVCLIIAGTASSYCFAAVKRRSHLLSAVFISSVFYALTFCAMSLIEASSVASAFGALCKGFLGGFLSGLITIGSIQFFEWIFNATTPMKLSELVNPENKLLKKLLVEAPGTYHHSLTVANISEIAARSIGANSMLARAGAYYHDIGKIRHPLYFKENQYDTNAHDQLSPEESSSLIIGHVTSGAEIAQKNRLPQVICDIIAQHHGTTTTGYFLIRARELDPDADASKFTYPGPIPQTKEAAIVMLADSCEAAVRSIDEKSDAKIEAMVRKIATERVNSGQFSQSNLTFSELETVIKVITKTLGGYFHERIKYE